MTSSDLKAGAQPQHQHSIVSLLATVRASIDSLDARVLLAWCLGSSTANLFAHPEQTVSDATANRFLALAEQRASGTPLAYLTGSREFWSLPLEVTQATLIPRPDTELLVQQCLALLPASSQLVADLGTGSGCIALALAWERPSWTIHASDLSADALAVARRNLQRLQQTAAAARRPLASTQLHQGNWLAALPPALRWDAIVSNPPYLASNDPHLPSLAAEPRRALVSGCDGLDAISTLVTDSPAHLRPGGWLLLEHGHTQAGLVQRLLLGRGFSQVSSASDLAGLDRVTLGRWQP